MWTLQRLKNGSLYCEPKSVSDKYYPKGVIILESYEHICKQIIAENL